MKKNEFIKDNTILFRKCFNNSWGQRKKFRILLLLTLFVVGNMALSSKSYGMQGDEIEKKGTALTQKMIEYCSAWYGKTEELKKAGNDVNELFARCTKQGNELKKCENKKSTCTSLNNRYAEKLDVSSSKKFTIREQLQQCDIEKDQCLLSNNVCFEKLEESNSLKSNLNEQLQQCDIEKDQCLLSNNVCFEKLEESNQLKIACNQQLQKCERDLLLLSTACNTTCSVKLEEMKNEFNVELHQRSIEKTGLFYDNYLLINELEECESEKNYTSSLNSLCVEKLEDSKNNILSSFKNENIYSIFKGAISIVVPEIIRDVVGYTRFSPYTEELVTVARGCILGGMTYCNADSFLPAMGAAMTGIVIRPVSDKLSNYLELTTKQKTVLNIVTNFGPSLLFNPDFVFDYMYYIVGSGLSLEAYAQIKSFISAQNQADGEEPETSSVLAIGRSATNVAIQSLPLLTEEQRSPRKQTESPHKITKHRNSTNNNYCNDDKSTTSVQLILRHEKEQSNEAEKVSISNQRSDGSFPKVKNSSQLSLINSSPKRKDDNNQQVMTQASEDFSNRYNREELGIVIKKVNSANEK